MKTLLSCGVITASLLLNAVAFGQNSSVKPAADTSTTPTSPSSSAPAHVALGDEMPGESITDVAEKDHKTYYFVGLRYRGTVIPKFMVNLFVDEGATFYSNTVGIEFEIRKDHFSLIPALNYVEYGFGNTLFLQKNGPGGGASNPGNWSMVSSSLKGIFLTLDLLWSTPIHKNVEFEYGLGVGVGALFGNIYNNWVTNAPSGSTQQAAHITASNNSTYYQCQSQADGPGCAAGAHSGADPNNPKINGYSEKTWAGGGSVPNVFLHLALPQLGLRIKPIKQFAGRIGFGFSLTGFWFGLSGSYGLEAIPKKTAPAASTAP